MAGQDEIGTFPGEESVEDEWEGLGDGDRRWVRIGGAIVDLASREVRRPGYRFRLTPTELKLLRVLLEWRGSPVHREKLLQIVWGMEGDALSSRAVDVNVGRLRQKLEAAPSRPRQILTVAGYGYLLQEERPDV